MSKVVILTGASRGIGASIARKILADNSTRLVAVARTTDKLEQLVSEYGSDRVGIVAGDVADGATAKKAVKEAVERFGRLDAVILNAGVLDPVAPVAEADVSQWKRLFDINLFSIVALVTEALPQLREHRGKVIAVSSGASTKAYSSWGAYGASKAALNHYILSLSSEEPQIQAVSVAPGVVDTQMQADIREVFGTRMSSEGLKRFTDLKTNNQLLHPDIPGTVYAQLALKEWPEGINGQYLRYNDEVLAPFQK